MLAIRRRPCFLRDEAVRIDHELGRRALVEVGVASRGIVERDHENTAPLVVHGDVHPIELDRSGVDAPRRLVVGGVGLYFASHLVINVSVNQVLSRSLLTSITVLITLLVIFFFNVGQQNILEGFSFAMIVGVLVGTYSSIYVASPLLLILTKREERKAS